MWNYYLDTMLLINRDQVQMPMLKRRLLTIAYRDAIKANQMSAEHYLQYLDIQQVADAKEDVMLEVSF